MKLKTCLLLLLMFCMGYIHAQNITVTGKVTDENGSPVIGATVVIKGTTSGTITDVDGNYSLDVSENNILAFSFVGMETVESRVTGSPINVVLKSDVIGLEEVVVIGYGSVKKSDLTGSVSSVNTEDMKERSISTVEGLLQGTAAGVQVTSGDGTPGGGMTVKIRGAASINASAEPLYVVDGFPIVSDQMETSGAYGGNFSQNIGGYTSPLSTINPGDIASIEILKDASATAIYGARGANGVVLITTKKGRAGKPKVTYDGYFGLQKVSKTMEMLSQEDYLEVVSLMLPNNTTWIDSITGQPHDYLYDPAYFIDWQDEIFVTGDVQSHNLGISGGSESSNYNLSLGHMRNNGIVLNSHFERYSARLNLETDINDRLKLVGRFSTNYTKYSGPFSGGNTGYFAGIIFSALRYRPIIPEDSDKYTDPAFNDPSTLGTDDNLAVTNPVRYANDLIRDYSRLNNHFDASADWEIIKGLTFRTLVGADFIYNQNLRYYPKTTAIGNFYQGRAQVDKQNAVTLLNENTTIPDSNL